MPASRRGGYRPGAGRPAKPRPLTAEPSAKRLAPTPSQPRMTADISAILEAMPQRAKQRTQEQNPFRLPAFPDAAMPPRPEMRMAMDNNMTWASNAWMAGGILNSVAEEGLLFPGYTYLSQLAQRTEYRILSETIADDATRKWIMFDITGTEEQKEERQAEDEADPEGAPDRREERLDKNNKSEKVRELMDFLDNLGVREAMYDLICGDGLFGRMHLYLSFGEQEVFDSVELRSPIGDGIDAISKAKVGPQNPLRRVKAIEPVWTYPMMYNAINPLLEDWYNPQYWYVMGQEIHVSRILPLVSRKVPDILKPSYAFGGISLSQLAEPYVDIWLKTRTSVADMIHSFSVMVLHTNLATLLQPGAQGELLARLALFNSFRDNMGTFVVNKETEDLTNVSASLSGLHELQAQAQEHMSFPARIPLVKLTGIAPSGLNASSEGEIRVYYDTISSYQNRAVRPVLNPVINFAQLSLWGEVDKDLTLEFEPLWEMSSKEEAELQKARAERDKIFVDIGAIAPEEVRGSIIGDPTLPFGGLDPEDVPDLAQEEEDGLMPGKGGAAPGAGGDGPSATRPAPDKDAD